MTDNTNSNFKKETWQFIKMNFGSCLSWAITIAWLVFIYQKIQQEALPKNLNEFGDFIAGAFAPLAFFWLVRGYYQQGHELQGQAIELKNSVKQQQRLAEIYEEEMRQKHFQVQPILIFTCNDIREYQENVPFEDEEGEIIDVQTQSAVDFYLTIQNVGESARHLLLISKPKTQYKRFEKYELKQNEFEKIKFCIDGQECDALYNGHDILRELKITFNDIYGKLFTKYITCKVSSHQDYETGQIYLQSEVFVRDKRN